MRIECRSNAKINWTLEVLGRRADGFHEVRTILQSIALHDSVMFESTKESIEIECDDPNVPCGEENLVYRAADLLRQKTGIQAGVHACINKRIPVGGGLGGGSSNAAVTLLALQKLWGISLSPRELIDIGERVGSDVPFFFLGGTAIGLGRGSEVYPLQDIGAEHMLLVTPSVQISTGQAYADLRKSAELTSYSVRGNIPGSCEAVMRALRPQSDTEGAFTWCESAGNDLEAVTAIRYPDIGRIVGQLKRLEAKMVRMSGSGSTVFAIFESADAARRAASGLPTESWRVVRTRTIGRGEYLDRLMRAI
jgi:4-diphosphocytidyl-2-C-methyl-D-erythritol kinase